MTYLFGIRDCKIAAWNNPENYGIEYDLDAISMMSVALNTISGTLEGDDEIKDVHAKVISATVRCRFAFTDLNVYATLTGGTVVDSPTVDRLAFDTSNLPYFALCAKIDHTSGLGDTHIFIPKMKVTEGFEISAEYGRYSTPELTMTAVREGSLWKVVNVLEHATAQAVTIPPT